MTRINRTAALLIAAAVISPLTLSTALAAGTPAREQPACTQSDSVEGVDCTVTHSTGERDQREPSKASKYPDGPVNMGSGVWF
ncbi:hypothetical protein DFR52_10780 [Hoeflea marina]|uniref:Uncharacterized protein n=1 Tax=Hoeflea marina TaxID=274592 RepID=A0A317PE30_9HYPH|nr:hypothetical protein [Hoeflea marina]PWV97168.1 hypothetical protein DFR52_10780 [Hoeflea marina]